MSSAAKPTIIAGMYWSQWRNQNAENLHTSKGDFMDDSRAEPTILFMKQISFSLKLFFGHFIRNPSLSLSEVL